MPLMRTRLGDGAPCAKGKSGHYRFMPEHPVGLEEPPQIRPLAEPPTKRRWVTGNGLGDLLLARAAFAIVVRERTLRLKDHSPRLALLELSPACLGSTLRRRDRLLAVPASRCHAVIGEMRSATRLSDG